jgi:hypothetical protein
MVVRIRLAGGAPGGWDDDETWWEFWRGHITNARHDTGCH